MVRLVSQADAARGLDADDDGAPAEPAATGEGVSVAGSLGAQFLLWEYAVAVAGRLLGINPFDQPDVESAKEAARGLLDRRPQPTPPDLVDGVVEIRATPGLLGGARTLDDAVDALLGTVGPRRLPGGHGLPGPRARRRPGRGAGAARPPARPAGDLRLGAPVPALDRPVPQGRPATGVFLQITADSPQDLAVPDRPFTFGQLIAAQAAGDAQVLAEHGRPVLRLHLRDRGEGLRRVERALGAATS